MINETRSARALPAHAIYKRRWAAAGAGWRRFSRSPHSMFREPLGIRQELRLVANLPGGKPILATGPCKGKPHALPASVVTPVALVLVLAALATSISRVGFQLDSSAHRMAQSPSGDGNSCCIRPVLCVLREASLLASAAIRASKDERQSTMRRCSRRPGQRSGIRAKSS